MRVRDLGAVDLALLSLLMGVATTVVFYRYGVDNHIAELPIVQRAIDPEHLPLDFYTNASAGPGPRSHFAAAVAALATRETLPGVYFVLTLLCNTAIAALTAGVARELFRGSGLAGALAAALVMSLATFRLGAAPELYVSQLLASRLTLPFLLAALWAGLRGRPLAAAAAVAPAALLHPTFGVQGGAIALGVAATVRAADPAAPAGPRVWLPALLLFAGAAALAALPSLSQHAIEGARFVAIETQLRHPHHSLPGALAPGELLRGAAFLLATALAWHTWRRWERPARGRALAVALLALGVPLLCAVGAVLVELLPTRLGAVARPLRLLLLLKWIGLALAGGLVARRLQSRADAVGERLAPGVGPFLLVAMALLATVARPSAGALFCLGLYVAAIAALASQRALAAGRAAAVAVAAALLAQLVWGERLLPAPLAARTARLRPALALDDLAGEEAELARWARANTPAHAVFLAPPDFGLFRLVAERALVVDFKAFPFQDAAMVAWQQRLFDCYGRPEAGGWAALREMRERYARVDPEALPCRYGATHAIVPRGAPTRRPALYESRNYKVLALADTPR